MTYEEAVKLADAAYSAAMRYGGGEAASAAYTAVIQAHTTATQPGAGNDEKSNPRAIIEYRWDGYSIPTDIEAWCVAVDDVRLYDVALTDIPGADDLTDVRDRLADLGFSQSGSEMIKTHDAGRFAPMWREIWKLED